MAMDGMTKLKHDLTQLVHDRIFLMGKDDPVWVELFEILRGGDHLPEATERVKAWFNDWAMTAVRGPLDQLAWDLITTCLDLVDWGMIVRAMREREE
jgi:hypothetical protein